MYAGQDFSPLNPPEEVNLGFDFSKRLQSGDTIASAEFDMTLFNGTDPDPDHLLGSPSIQGSIVLNTVGTPLANCIYIISATINTTNGEILLLWSRLSCMAMP